MLTFDQYPIFAANQVLRNDHLNQVFNYLDEQGRLTRSQLLGVGIVCGLEVRLDPASARVFIDEGLGVTSAGHLVLYDSPGPLTHRRPYTPLVSDGETFGSVAAIPPLSELLPGSGGAAGTEPLDRGTIERSVVVLYYELFEEDNRNCDPNGCDDRGATMHATVVPLLVAREDLGKLGAAGQHTAMAARSSLPRLRLPRVPGVANAVANRSLPRLATTADVTEAFRTATEALAQRLRAGLLAAYTTFRPALIAADAVRYADNPFLAMAQLWNAEGRVVAASGFALAGGFQDRFDHLVTLARAYEELRAGAEGVLTACRPAAEGFPRHLCLGGVSDAHGRHHFLHSPLFAAGGTAQGELVRLFDRLVALKASFAWPKRGNGGEVRATPSQRGKAVLSARAIPYLYAQDVSQAALWRSWAAARSLLGGAGEVLGYRARDWSADPDVVEPLRHDLEEYGFLRVEGHLGLDYREALGEVLRLKADYRLPIDVVALRTGSGAPVTATGGDAGDDCDFDDLETLYQSLREQFVCHAAEVVRELYGVEIQKRDSTVRPGLDAFAANNPALRQIQLPLLSDVGVDVELNPGTVGALYEIQYSRIVKFGYVGPSADADPYAKLRTYLAAQLEDVGGSKADQNGVFAAAAIYMLGQLYEIITPQLGGLDLGDWRNRYAALQATLSQTRTWVESGYLAQNDLQSGPWIDRLQSIATICLRGALTKVAEEYARRKANLTRRTTLADFAARHPGLQHGAGVPVGGTLVLVYHGADTPERRVITVDDAFRRRGELFDAFRAPAATIGGRITADLTGRIADRVDWRVPLGGGTPNVVEPSDPLIRPFDPSIRLEAQPMRFLNQPLRVVNEPLYMAKERRIQLSDRMRELLGFDRELVVTETANGGFEANVLERSGTGEQGLRPGEVIADFFLPYVLTSECAPIQFTLPARPPVTSLTQSGCGTRDANGVLTAVVDLSAIGGTPPYRYTTDDGQTWTDLPVDGAKVTLTDGTALGLMDAEGTRGPDRTVRLTPPLAVRVTGTTCADDRSTYTAVLNISGGKAPYALAAGVEFTSVAPDANGRASVTVSSEIGSATVTVTDAYAEPCAAEVGIERPADCSVAERCDLPCDGIVSVGSLPFWLPVPVENGKVTEVKIEGVDFTLSTTSGRAHVAVVEERFAADSALVTGLNTSLRGSVSTNWFATGRVPRKLADQLNGVLTPLVNNALNGDVDPGFALAYTDQKAVALGGEAGLQSAAFACHRWRLVLRVAYVTAGVSYEMTYAYTHEGLQVTGVSVAGAVDSNGPREVDFETTVIPSFHRSRQDRCLETEESFCKEPPKPGEIKTVLRGLKVQASLRFEQANAKDFVVYWQALGSQVPVVANVPGKPAEFTYVQAGTYEISAMAIERETGCVSVTRTQFEIKPFR